MTTRETSMKFRMISIWPLMKTQNSKGVFSSSFGWEKLPHFRVSFKFVKTIMDRAKTLEVLTMSTNSIFRICKTINCSTIRARGRIMDRLVSKG